MVQYLCTLNQYAIIRQVLIKCVIKCTFIFINTFIYMYQFSIFGTVNCELIWDLQFLKFMLQPGKLNMYKLSLLKSLFPIPIPQ